MATKKVQSVLIDLNIKGAEKLAALKGSFRDLGKTIGQTDNDIDAARKSVIEYGKTANQSEAVVKGQIKAFEGLREQAQMGGKVYRELSNDIATLKSQLNGSTPAIDAQRKALIESASSAKLTRSQLIGLLSTLSALQKQTTAGSKAFAEIGDDIANLESKIIKVKAAQEDLNRVTLAGNQAAAGGAAATRLQIKAIDQKVASLREEKQQLESLKRQEKARLGFQTILERPGDVPFRTREYIEGAVAEAALGGNITKKFGQKEIETAINAVKQSVIELQSEIEVELARGARRTFQEMARDGRESARSLAQAFSGPEFERIFSNLDKNVGELPNTTAGLSQRLRELERVLNNTARGGDNYVAVALEIARVQREASAATQGLGAALIKDLASGAAVRNQKNLREVIGQLQAEMSELNTETAEGSAKYAENARQVNNLQKELEDIANSYRTVTDMARQATGAQAEYANTRVASNYLRRDIVRARQAAAADVANAVVQAAAQTPLLLPAAGGTTAPGTGAFMSGLAEPKIAPEARLGGGGEGIPVRPQLGDVQAISAKRYMGPQATDEQLDAARRQYISETEAVRQNAKAKKAAADAVTNYRAEISKATQAYDGSINSSNRLRSALEQFRSTLPPTNREFDKLTDQINRLDRESEKVSRRMSRRRMSPMQMTQAAGAVLSGGIFGGPEGFLGGAIGSLGGVGGAFAGAAIGAQVGGIRRTLGEYADYAAQITRLQIALEGISGSQAQYNRALQAAADVTAQLNVPQEVAVQGMTRLVAAVKGAGGGVAEAEVAFKNINSAIIATGGGAEQVQGAVTALVQIFSKGKVSAEEINQIAERLPGTFNKIAEASGRTGPELTKALQQGTVGLNDLMKFLVSLGDEYGELAQKIAGSSENAGARLQVAFNEMRIEVGNALQPIGAEFQDAFAEFIRDITPLLVAVLPKIGELALALAENIDILTGAIIGLGTAMLAVNFKSFIAGIVKIKAVATGAKFAALLVNPWVALAAGIGAAVVALGRYKREAINTANAVKVGNEASRIAAFKQLSDTNAQISLLELKRKEYQEAGGKTRQIRTLDRQLARLRGDRDALKEALKATEPASSVETTDIKEFDDPSVKDGKGKGKGKKARISRLDAIRDSAKLLDIEKQILDNAREITQAQADANFARVNQLNNQKISLEFAKRSAENEFEYAEAVRQAANSENKNAEIAKAALKKEIQDKLLLLQYESALADEAQRSALAAEQRQRALGDEIFGLRDQLGLVTDDQRIARYRAQLEQQYGADDPKVGEAVDLFRQQIDPTFLEGIQQAIRSIRDELETLTDPINQITGAATAIGEAFSESFMDTITGASTAREALASFFRNVGNYFLDLAGKIIAKLIEIAVLESLTSVFGGGTSGGGSGFLGRLFGFKDGGVVKGIEPFAKGGIVDKPTLFKYADGGSGRFGLMGEAGSEAIMPLRRGRNGKLGVEATGVSMGDINVNVDASGSSVEGDATRSNQLGKAIGVAVQQELVRQKRPGGLLYSSM